MKKITKSASETRNLGKKIGEKIIQEGYKEKTKILALEGELGAGKTTFLQGLAKGLGIKEKILSPTFIIFKKFNIPNSDFSFFYHIDCYRINDAKELLSLGFNDFINNQPNIVAIEWPKKIKSILPKNKIVINFKMNNSQERIITIQ